jgi:hypothetical protein
MPEYFQSMPTKHTWTFKPRLRARTFGWQGSHLACQRLKEAVTEIKKVDRVDPVAAGDGVVTLMERISPAFQDIDTSTSGQTLCDAQGAFRADAGSNLRGAGWTIRLAHGRQGLGGVAGEERPQAMVGARQTRPEDRV